MQTVPTHTAKFLANAPLARLMEIANLAPEPTLAEEEQRDCSMALVPELMSADGKSAAMSRFIADAMEMLADLIPLRGDIVVVAMRAAV